MHFSFFLSSVVRPEPLLACWSIKHSMLLTEVKDCFSCPFVTLLTREQVFHVEQRNPTRASGSGQKPRDTPLGLVGSHQCAQGTLEVEPNVTAEQPSCEAVNDQPQSLIWL